MENQIIQEIIKGLAVIIFGIAFYIVIKKSTAIVNGFEKKLKEKGWTLEAKGRRKVLFKVVKNQISLKPYNHAQMEEYVVNKLFPDPEFKKSIEPTNKGEKKENS